MTFTETNAVYGENAAQQKLGLFWPPASEYMAADSIATKYNIELIVLFSRYVREIFDRKKFAAIAQTRFIDLTETPYFTADHAHSACHLTVEKV